MFLKTAVIILTFITAAGAASTVDIQLGLTQFYRGEYYGYDWDWDYDYELENKLGYAGDIKYEFSFSNWAVGLNLRALAFPGSERSSAWYADIIVPFYFTEAPVRVYAAPGLGYNHTEKRIIRRAMPTERAKHDFFRFPLAFGVKAISGSKYLDIRFQLTPEIPTGKTTDVYYYEDVLDFYLEQSIEVKFGWRFAKYFGMTVKAGTVRGNRATAVNTGDDAPPYVPFVEVGPSIYF
jgi:hypothetical protein